MHHGPVCRRGAGVLAIVAALLLPAAASAAPDAAFSLSVPEPCAAGSCQVVLDYDSSGLSNPALVAVDWHHAGDPELGFQALSQTTCTSLAACVLRSPVYDTPGTYDVALRVTDLLDQSIGYETQVVQVLAPAQTTARQPQPTRVPDKTAASPELKLCAPVRAGEQCGAGNGRKTAGGGALVSHAGWPAVTGILWKVLDSRGHRKTGGSANDELLGHHGSDRLDGGPGADILWGDWDPSNNNTRQRDVLAGGAGNDWIYPSHGTNTVRAGGGADHVKAYYGHGVIDCGPGRDTAQVRTNGAYRLRNCERVVHFCQFGSTPDGTCKQPGAAGSRRR